MTGEESLGHELRRRVCRWSESVDDGEWGVVRLEKARRVNEWLQVECFG
jgi:hypothetical protein